MPTKVSEKTDSYVDNLRMGLEVWEKQLMLGGELEVWAAAKLGLFAESDPFSSEKEIFETKVWKPTVCDATREMVCCNVLLICLSHYFGFQLR